MARSPVVQVVASDTRDRLQAPSTNEALQLASALGDLVPEARELAQRVNADQTKQAKDRARLDAMRTSGAAFGDAVRQGYLEPTQNPWYIAAYDRESAQVQTTQRMAQVATESQTWEERNDPAAFQERLNKTIGEVGSAYTTEEARQGFLAASAPALQQLAASNQARNVARITAERDTNAATLAAQAIQDTITASGGRINAQAIADALRAQQAEYVGTGQSPEEWNAVVIQAVTTAGYNSNNPDIMDILKDPALDFTGTGTPLYNAPGVAADVEVTQFRIRQAFEENATRAEAMLDAQTKAEASVVREWAMPIYDEQLLLGDIDVQQFITDAQAKGYSTAAIGEFLASTARTVNQIQSLQAARLKANEFDTQNGGGLATIRLAARAAREPLTPALQADIEAAYLRGDIPEGDAARLANTAQQNGEQLARSSGGGGSRSGSGGGGSSGGGNTVSPTGRFNARNLTQMNQRIEARSYYAFSIARTRAGREVGDRADLKEKMKEAAMIHLASNPGDYTGAAAAAEQRAANWVGGTVFQAQQRRPAPPPGGGNGNPRR